MGKVIYLSDPNNMFKVSEIKHLKKIEEIKVYEHNLLKKNKVNAIK